jgi:hypothetical protein
MRIRKTKFDRPNAEISMLSNRLRDYHRRIAKTIRVDKRTFVAALRPAGMAYASESVPESGKRAAICIALRARSATIYTTHFGMKSGSAWI